MVRIGILGGAEGAQRLVIPSILTLPEYSLKAIVSRDKTKSTRLANLYNCHKEDSYENLVSRPDIDAIYIPLPVALHYFWAKKALDFGKHVLVEKSFTHDLDMASELVELATQKNLVVMENFMFLYHSQQTYVKGEVDSGLIGDVRCFRSSFGFPPLSRDNIRYKKELGGGSLLDAAAYPIRASQMFLGGSLTVSAATLFVDPQLDVDIFGGAFLTNNAGLFSEIAFGFDNFYQCNYEIWGSLGKITVHRAFTAGPNFLPQVTVEHQGKEHKIQLSSDNHAKNMLKEFSHAIINQEKRIRFYGEIIDQAKIIHEVRVKAKRVTENIHAGFN